MTIEDRGQSDAIIDLTDEVERLQKLNEKLTGEIRWWVRKCHALESWQEDACNLHPRLRDLRIEEEPGE